MVRLPSPLKVGLPVLLFILMVTVAHLTFTTAVPAFTNGVSSSADASTPLNVRWFAATGLTGANIKLKLFVPSNSQDLAEGFFASSWLPFVERSTISGGSVDNSHPIPSWEKSATDIVTMVWDCTFTFTSDTPSVDFYLRSPFQFPFSFTVIELQSSPPPTSPSPTIWYSLTRNQNDNTKPPIPLYSTQAQGSDDEYIIYIDELLQYAGPSGEALSKQLSFALFQQQTLIDFDYTTASFEYITDDPPASIPFTPKPYSSSRWEFPGQLPPNTRRIKIQLPSPLFVAAGSKLILEVKFQSFDVASARATLDKEKITASVTTGVAENSPFSDIMYHGMSEMKFSIQAQPLGTAVHSLFPMQPPIYQRDMFFTRCISSPPAGSFSIFPWSSLSAPSFSLTTNTLSPVAIDCFAVFSPFASRISSTPNSQDQWSQTRIQYSYVNFDGSWSDFLTPSTLSSKDLSTVTHSITPINLAIKPDIQPEWTFTLKFNGAIFPEMYDIKFDNLDSGVYFEITPISSASTIYPKPSSTTLALTRQTYPIESLGDNTFRITAPVNQVYLATELKFKIKCAYYTYPTALGDDFRWASSLDPLEPVPESVSSPSSLRVTWSRSAGPSPAIPASYSDSITFKLPHMHQPALTITTPIAQKWDMPAVVMTQITLNQYGLFYPSTSELLASMVDSSIWYENNGALQLWPNMQIRIEIDSLNPSVHSFNLATPLPSDFVIIDDSSDDFIIFEYTGSEIKTLTEGIVFDVESSSFPSGSVYELIGNVSLSLSIKLDDESTFTQSATPTQPIYFGRAVINDDYTNTVLSLQSTSKSSPQTKIDIDITLKPLVPTTTTTTIPVVSNDATFTLSFLPHADDFGFETVSVALWEYIGQTDGTISTEATSVTDNIISITDLEGDEKTIKLPSLSHHQNAFLRFTYTFIEASGRPDHVVDTTSFTIVPNCFDLKSDETEAVWDSFATSCPDLHSVCSYSTGECVDHTGSVTMSIHSAVTDPIITPVSIPRKIDNDNVELPITPVVSCHDSIQVTFTPDEPLGYDSAEIQLWYVPVVGEVEQSPVKISTVADKVVGDGNPHTFPLNLKVQYTRAFFRYIYSSTDPALETVSADTVQFVILAECMAVKDSSPSGAVEMVFESYESTCLGPLEDCDPETGTCRKSVPLTATQSFSFIVGVYVVGMVVMALV